MLAFDLETHPIGPGAIAPKPVCITIADEGFEDIAAACETEFEGYLDVLLDGEHEICGHNVAFDLACILVHYPHYGEKIFTAYAKNLVTDTMIREKLLVLGDTGDLEFITAPDGSTIKRRYDLASLERQYLGIDRTLEKEGGTDIWRVNYDALDGIPACEYPEDAREYAVADARNTHAVFCAQEERAKGGVYSPLKSQYFQARAAFALFLQTVHGFAIDQERVKKLIAEMAERFADVNFPTMLAAGVLRPVEPARPHTRSLKKAMLITGGTTDWAAHREALEREGIKFTEAKPSSIDTTILKAIVQEVCIAKNLPVPTTDKGNISFDTETQQLLAGLHPVLDEYSARQEIAKLVTTELPRIDAPRVHPRYDVLKETGRTSSYGSAKNKPDLYPAVNIQQIDPRVRPCYIASPGTVLCSVDYDYLELVSIAQKCKDLFNHSVLGDKINTGTDPHAYLGAALAYFYDAEFRASCRDAKIESQELIYRAFLRLKDIDPKRYKHYRTFAKPTGLGFPGGLGAETFVTYSRVTYGVDLVKIAGSEEGAIEMAKQLKQLWLNTYPEMEAYFRWVSNDCLDRDWTSEDDQRYMYVSPMGMVRRNCSYTAATNGAAMQTPAAEGAKQALWNLARACYDSSQGSCLLGCRPLAFIHDQVIAEIPQDEQMHERAFEMARLMRESMQLVMRDVKVGAVPMLMLRWHKEAETVYGSDGRLAVWTPQE